MEELKLKFGKMAETIAKTIKKSSKNNKAMMSKNKSNCNIQEVCQHFIDCNLS